MELYISEFSKYVITLLMILYTWECFSVFRFQEESGRSGVYARQNILMFALHFSCFVVICFETSDVTYLFFMRFSRLSFMRPSFCSVCFIQRATVLW